MCFSYISCLTFNIIISDIYHIDLLSLDIEGGEFSVLKTIPFDEVYITNIYVETNITPKRKVEQLLFANGYVIAENFQNNTLFRKMYFRVVVFTCMALIS